MINKKDLYLGDSLINSSDLNIEGKEVVIKNENFYKISNVNKMRPFFMSIVSAYDHWLFISSTGALSISKLPKKIKHDKSKLKNLKIKEILTKIFNFPLVEIRNNSI